MSIFFPSYHLLHLMFLTFLSGLYICYTNNISLYNYIVLMGDVFIFFLIKIDRNYLNTKEVMRLVQWYMKPKPGWGTLCMDVWEPYPLFNNKLMCSKPNWHWHKQRLYTWECANSHHYQINNNNPQCFLKPPMHHQRTCTTQAGSCLHKPSPFLAWTWSLIRPTWGNPCGHTSLINKVMACMHACPSLYLFFLSLLLLSRACFIVCLISTFFFCFVSPLP